MTNESFDPSVHMTWHQMFVSVRDATGEANTARWMCESAGGFDAGEFAAAHGDPVPERAGRQIESMLRRYLGGEPLQYVLGHWSFRHVDLMVDMRVLIPRPETELIVDIVLGHARGTAGPVTIADLGTGSGAIGLALLDELPHGSATVWMTDASQDALDVARANAAGLGRAAAGARFAHGDWYGALDDSLRGTFDAIVSNPPYIAADDAELDATVREWEPSSALLAADDGVADLHTVIEGAAQWLRPGGLVVTEIGRTQGGAVAAIAEAAGLHGVTVHKDLAGHDRFVSAFRPA